MRALQKNNYFVNIYPKLIKKIKTIIPIIINQLIVQPNNFIASFFRPSKYKIIGLAKTKRPVMAAETTNKSKRITGCQNWSGLGNKCVSAEII